MKDIDKPTDIKDLQDLLDPIVIADPDCDPATVAGTLDDFGEYHNFNCNQNIGEPYIIQDVSECRGACDCDPKCKSFHYKDDGKTKECTLKECYLMEDIGISSSTRGKVFGSLYIRKYPGLTRPEVINPDPEPEYNPDLRDWFAYYNKECKVPSYITHSGLWQPTECMMKCVEDEDCRSFNFIYFPNNVPSQCNLFECTAIDNWDEVKDVSTGKMLYVKPYS